MNSGSAPRAPLSLTEDSIPRLIWRIAAPMSVGMFFGTMFNVVDTWCAGWLGTDALAALSLSFPLFFVIFAVGSGLSQGATALLANTLGARQPEEARRVFAQSLVFALGTAVLLSTVGVLAAPLVFRALGAEGDYLGTTLAYMNPILLGAVAFYLPMMFNTALTAEGETRVYRNFLVAGFLANIVLNPLLMGGVIGGLPGFGVTGIALATVLIQAVGAFAIGRVALRVSWLEGIGLQELRPDFPVLGRIAAQALPAMGNMLTIALGIFVLTWFVQHFGKEAVAASGIATRIEQIVLLPSIGLNAAVLTLVGRNHGAGLFRRVRTIWLMNLGAGVGMMLAGGLLVWLLREPAMGLFTDKEEVIGHGADYLLAASLTLAAYPILFVTVFALQGMKRPAFGLWIGLYRQFAAPLILIHNLAFVLGWGTWGIWWGICFVTWSAALVCFWWGWRLVGRPMGPDGKPLVDRAWFPQSD